MSRLLKSFSLSVTFFWKSAIVSAWRRSNCVELFARLKTVIALFIAKTERIQTGVRFVDFLLDIHKCGGHRFQFGHCSAVDFPDVRMRRVWIMIRQKGISSDPIEKRPLTRATAPLGKSPGA